MKSLIFILILATTVLGCKQSKSNGQKKSMNDTTYIAVIQTNMGTIKCELLPQAAPKAVENFIGLSDKGYYNKLTFHRVIDNFMIQGGDPNGNGTGGKSVWGGTFNDEFNENYKFDSAGVMAMANRGPNTNGSQFFITLEPTHWLDMHYSIFGKVIDGMDVVKAIGKVPTTKPNDKPVTPVVMDSVYIERKTGTP
jgi:cyclophilin family peptidyl-prolyl cis-trans isomerase